MTSEQSSIWLIVETSGRTGFVALASANGIVAVRRLEDGRKQARDLAPRTQELLVEANLAPRDLAGIVVSLGPGSYTGLRVGLISARVLAHVTGARLVGVPTFETLAEQVPGEGRIDVLADAQKEKVYHQSFLRTGTDLQPASELRILPWDEWAATCAPGTRITGPGALKYPEHVPAASYVVAEGLREVTPTALWSRALLRIARGAFDDPYSLDPLYLRPSSAEEQWDARKK